MPINTDLSQVVFRIAIITEKYAGGVEQFKEDFKFSLGKYNMEDNELLSMVAMNAEDIDLVQAAEIFHRIVDDENYIIGSDDFVVINRYGGKMWNCDWVTSDNEDYPVFFWDIQASERAIEEALERCDCTVNEIETRYGTWMKWGEAIL
jgi:hypothetical protein